MTYPLQPTERDRERFRDLVKQQCGMSWADDDFERYRSDYRYRWHICAQLWRIWWSVERERQLLHNLNQSQGAEISRLMNKIKQLEAL